MEKEIMISHMLMWQYYPQWVRRGDKKLKTEKLVSKLTEWYLNITWIGWWWEWKETKDAKESEASSHALLII